MSSMLFAKSAVFFDFQSVGSGFFIFLLVVITLFAFRASERNFNSASGRRHKILPPKKITPSKGANILYLNVPKIPISSTDIRNRVKLHQSISDFVPEKVQEYIVQEHLYEENS